MAKPYREGAGWSVRVRTKGQDIYLSGYATESAATKAAAASIQALSTVDKPVGRGPWQTTVAEAMQKYALERLAYLKGASQVADRFNRYLRLLGMDVIQVQKLATTTQDARSRSVYFSVELVECPSVRSIPKSLKKHRDQQLGRMVTVDALRQRLAMSKMAEVTPHQMQTLIDAMVDEGCGAATVGLERAELRQLFNHARKRWQWPAPMFNPGAGLIMPKVDNKRERVITNAEWRRLSDVLAEYPNQYVAPALLLLLETTMRASEALVQSTWADVNWEGCKLTLREAKAGRREVPLNVSAMALLRDLYQRRDPESEELRILPLTYEALKKAWNMACEIAGVDDANIHDLRHTGTTRYALIYHGSKPVLKVITGHKTDSQLDRYINIKTDDVVRMMHGRTLDEDSAPAGMTTSEALAVVPQPAAPASEKLPAVIVGNVVHVDFRRAA